MFFRYADKIYFYLGTARRGEDGDQAKVRRQPKPGKPKKISKVDGQFIVSAACNNGSTALVTRDGELLMFGKDTTHADHTTGLVCNLKGEFVVNVALGKAHAVALTSKGQVYTFGINNKYQCGRDFVPHHNKEGAVSVPSVVAMETCGTQDEQDMYEDSDDVALKEDIENIPGGRGFLRKIFGILCVHIYVLGSDANSVDSENLVPICVEGSHSWKQDMCMICTVCRECTGYSVSCLSSMRPDRNPGQ